MNEERIKELFSDEEYVKELVELREPEKIQKSLSEKGVELTVEEIKQLLSMLEKIASGEQCDEDLEKVAGGWTLIGPAVKEW